MECSSLRRTLGLDSVEAGKLNKRVVLISNQVMHYRVSVYNYFHQRLGKTKRGAVGL